MTKKLSQKELEMLYDYEMKFGKEKADAWRQKLFDATPEKVQIQIQESVKIPDITKMRSWNKILKTSSAKAYLKLFIKIVEMLNEIRDMENWHGYTYILIKTPKGLVFIKQQEIAVNPESEENILKGENEMPEDRVIMEDTEESEE